jgi:hypothetical protein
VGRDVNEAIGPRKDNALSGRRNAVVAEEECPKPSVTLKREPGGKTVTICVTAVETGTHLRKTS